MTVDERIDLLATRVEGLVARIAEIQVVSIAVDGAIIRPGCRLRVRRGVDMSVDAARMSACATLCVRR